MKKETRFFYCRHCGNIVTLVRDSGASISCCGEKMIELKPNVTDAATEKHVPIIDVGVGKINVTVGEVLHPMSEEHFIEWIALETMDRLEFQHLKPNDQPKAEFFNASSGTVYAYCNLHGLWKADF